GYSVALLEQKALAAGTSGRSSKLIHGGLRYLEGGHLRLVRESLRERRQLLRLAPDLVSPVPFHIPVYGDTARPAWKIAAGLALYALLAGITPLARFSIVPRRKWNDLDGLKTEGLKAVFRYWDAQADDAALTRAVWRSAESFGATSICPATLVAAQSTAQGVKVRYRQGDAEHELMAGMLINAAGPWVNEILKLVSPPPKRIPIELVQGTHIVLPGHLERGVYYTEAPDRRAVFVMPWQDRTLVGTTETVVATPADVGPRAEEIAYLLAAYRRYFPHGDATVLDSFAGLRVLPAGEGAAFGRSREVVLHVDEDGAPRVLTIYGGKLTGYRATAGKVLRYVGRMLGERAGGISTSDLPLTDAD
ncbi:MAG TPA: FAD-dependent oxidoreductase, partial [Mariprofundaceae bacterium]|nr:FAD-dependent oxidoreductase [Mariprofundaceae bacterium]